MHGFLSYAHADHRLFAAFRPHLVALRRAFDLDVWTDHRITTGTLWEPSIADAIAAAQVFVLMITPEFIASDYVHDKEMPAIAEREHASGALVLPIVLKPCLWQYMTGAWQASPVENGSLKPVTDWRRVNDGFDCARGQMMKAIERHFAIAPKRFGGRPA